MDMQKIWPKVRRLEDAAEAGGMGRTVRKSVTVTARDSYLQRDLIGLTVTDYRPGRRKLVVPNERPILPGDFAVASVRYNNAISLIMEYGTYNGALNKPCFLASGDLLPEICGLFANNSVYDSLLYAYETTSDNLGAGITIAKGWYALNKTTFAHEAINIEDYPVYLIDDGYIEFSGEEESLHFFEGCFPFFEHEIYTISEGNLHTRDNGVISVSNSTMSNPNVSVTLMRCTESFLYNTEDGRVWNNLMSGGKTTIAWDEIHPIDPKFLPTTVIDLDAWGITPTIVALYMAGGGSQSLDIDHDAFWKAIPTKNRFVVRCTVQNLIDCSAVNTCYDKNGDVVFFTAQLVNVVSRITVSFGLNEGEGGGSETEVYVKAEPFGA